MLFTIGFAFLSGFIVCQYVSYRLHFKHYRSLTESLALRGCTEWRSAVKAAGLVDYDLRYALPLIKEIQRAVELTPEEARFAILSRRWYWLQFVLPISYFVVLVVVMILLDL